MSVYSRGSWGSSFLDFQYFFLTFNYSGLQTGRGLPFVSGATPQTPFPKHTNTNLVREVTASGINQSCGRSSPLVADLLVLQVTV